MSHLPLAQAPASICLLRLSAIGDVTHMLPIVATLQKAWPHTQITWIIGKTEYALVKSLDHIEFIVFDKNNGISEYRTLRKKIKGRQFDVLLMMQVALRANLISLLITAKNKIGFDKARSVDFHQWFCKDHIEGPGRVHVLETYFQFLEKLGIKNREMNWLLKADKTSQQFASHVIAGKPTVIINPCSSARKNNWRNWPESRYARLIDYLMTQLQMQVLLTGGPDHEEVAFSNRITQQCRQAPVNLVGKTSLMQLLALLEQARLLIAPDTGPAHMGTVADIPVIGLYASSNPHRTGPYKSLQNSINVYPEALQKFKHKTPEQAKWGERVRHPDVMKMISLDAVINQLDKLID